VTPALLPGVLLLGLVSAVALWLYLAASSALPFGLFGLLSYLEPVLLVLGAVVLLGEPLAGADAAVYGPIVVALLLLAVEQLPRRQPSEASSPPTAPLELAHSPR
jgi:chloramphenicol-sensitive protein RarD